MKSVFQYVFLVVYYRKRIYNNKSASADCAKKTVNMSNGIKEFCYYG